MRTLLIVLATLAALGGLHALGLWMERRGWIYYWHRRASGNALGQTALEVQTLLESGKARHVQEAKAGDPEHKQKAQGEGKG